jgi:hypothetical protein
LGFVWVGWMYGFHGFSPDFYGFFESKSVKIG